MPYIKKLVMKGFKSFAKETEILFDKSMNVIVGPNGSGKSNIIDALCFVLGRLSMKSIRAAKSANLIFAGTKQYRPGNEASVKLVLDNSDKKFSLDNKEIVLERLVRTNGQSIYRINEETKTRQEILELLAQAGIDPYGFNIILQGEIDSIIRTNSEERRKVMEEVAGISIYELRKEKSLRELEKSDERLKEVSSILRERTSYLKNLEEERKQALKFKKLEETVKKCKASILKRKIEEKAKELSSLNEQKEKKEKEKFKLKTEEQEIREKIDKLQQEIAKINAAIQKSSGIEQEQLNNDISNLRAELAGLSVRKENNEARLQEILAKRKKSEEEIRILEKTIEEMKKEAPSQARKYQELDKKKAELEKTEEEKKKFYNLKEKLNGIKDKVEDKQINLDKSKNEISFLLKEIDKTASSLIYRDTETCKKELIKLKEDYKNSKQKLENIETQARQAEKLISVFSSEISSLENIKKQITKLEICPLCKSKITQQHILEVTKESDEKISELSSKYEEKQKFTEESSKNIDNLKRSLNMLEISIPKAEINLVKLENIEEKKEHIKRLSQEETDLNEEIILLSRERKSLENKILLFRDIEETYDKIFLEIQEISSRTEANVDSELEFKARDLEKLKMMIKQSNRDEQELNNELEEISSLIEENENLLEEKEKEHQELEKRFQTFIEHRTNLEKQIHENETSILKLQNSSGNIENEINNLKIELARLSAEKENLQLDFESYKELEIINAPIFNLQERLEKAQIELQTIGSVNLRALEVYDKMKEEYDAIAAKVSVLESEKLEILKIIEEIDKKKRKTFVKTLDAINELFNRNFTQLSTKGEVFLELENQEDIFAGGLDIIVKVGKGKYFDVTSLSGGEQTLVALSLIFGIQEYKPYSFYIFDEVDAALDKRNSERLALLVKKYMKTGQYVIITHNDAIITESTILYGVSMQEGISKILSLEI